MVIVETSVFTRGIQRLLSDIEYRLLQLRLIIRPDAGKIIPGSGGIRKLRWKSREKGTRGGLRIIYYWISAEDVVYMLLPYAKTEKDDLSKQQLSVLAKLVKEELQ